MGLNWFVPRHLMSELRHCPIKFVQLCFAASGSKIIRFLAIKCLLEDKGRELCNAAQAYVVLHACRMLASSGAQSYGKQPKSRLGSQTWVTEVQCALQFRSAN